MGIKKIAAIVLSGMLIVSAVLGNMAIAMLAGNILGLFLMYLGVAWVIRKARGS